MNRIICSFLIAAQISLTACSGVDVGSVSRVVQQTFQATKPLSDEEEYYVGRAVAARILSTYPLLENSELTEYVNLVGKTIAVNSDKPYTYGGYHFAVLDSEEINAFACPGGIILLTKGMVYETKNEDELAAVLAHEVAHINNRDGLAAIQKARLTEVATLIGKEAAYRYTPAEVAQLVSVFEGSIDDVFKTLVVNGYGKSQEYTADKNAITYLERAGYDPYALKNFLARLVNQGQGAGGGIMKTHPPTSERIANVETELTSDKVDESLVQLRSQRFNRAL